MIYPQTTFAGQKVTICNRYVEQFRQEAIEHPSGINARALRLELDVLIPDAYRPHKLIWLNIKWRNVLEGQLNPDYPLISDIEYLIPPIPEEAREAATAKMNEVLHALREFYKYQREVHGPTVKRLLHERHKAMEECRQDTTHNPTLSDFKRASGKLVLDVPSKNPRNESTNVAFAIRALKKLGSSMDDEHHIAVAEALSECKQNTRDSDFWDNKLDKELVRVILNLPEPPDPIENFTTYTEVDPGGQVAVTPSTITGTNVTRDLKTYVYDDKGIDHFDGDFSHDVDIRATNGTQQVMGSWALTNDINDLSGLISTNRSFLVMQHNVGTTWVLREFISGSPIQDVGTLTDGQLYHPTIYRDENIGSFGQLTGTIYSDVDRTSPADTLAVILRAKLDLRYVFALMSFNDGDSDTGNLGVSNLDLKEVVAAAVRRRRMLLRNN